MSLSDIAADSCTQGGDGILEPSRRKVMLAVQACSSEAEDVEISLDKFSSAEKFLLSDNTNTHNVSVSIKKYRDTYFQLLFAVLSHNLTKPNLQSCTNQDKILREIFAYQDDKACDTSDLSFRIENDLIEASVSYVNHHCAFQHEIRDSVVLRDDRRIQLLSNMRNALLSLATASYRKLSTVHHEVALIASQALLELQLEAVEAAQTKSCENASYLDLVKSLRVFKSLLIEPGTLQSSKSLTNYPEKLLHIGRVNSLFFIAAMKIFFKTVGIISALMKETELLSSSSEFDGSDANLRYDEALFNFIERKCALLSVIENEISSEFEANFLQVFSLFVEALICFVGKIKRKSHEVIEPNSVEEKFINILNDSVPGEKSPAKRITFMKSIAQFHGFIVRKMEVTDHALNVEKNEIAAVVDNLTMSLTSHGIGHQSISAEDVLLFVSEIKRRLIHDCCRELGDVCFTLVQGGVLERLNDAVTQFISTLYSGGPTDILEVTEAHDSCLASLWVSRMFPQEMSHHLRAQNPTGEDATVASELSPDSDVLGKPHDGADSFISTDDAVRLSKAYTQSQTSGIGRFSENDDMSAAGIMSLDFVSVGLEPEMARKTRPSNVIVETSCVLKVESSPVLGEKEKGGGIRTRKARSMSNRVDRQKKVKCKSKNKLSKPMFDLIAKAVEIIRVLKKVRQHYYDVLRDIPFISEDEEDERVLPKKVEDEEERKETELEISRMEEMEKEERIVAEIQKTVEVEVKRKDKEEKEIMEVEEENEEETEKLADGPVEIERKEEEEQENEETEEARIEEETKEEEVVDEELEKIPEERTTEAEVVEENEEESFEDQEKPIEMVAVQQRVSTAMQLRASVIGDNLFVTSEHVRPSFRPVFQKPRALPRTPPPSRSYEATCVRLDRELLDGPPPFSKSACNFSLSDFQKKPQWRQAVDVRDAAFSSLAEAVLRGRCLPVDAGPGGRRRSAAFRAEVMGALRRFVAAHDRTAEAVARFPVSSVESLARTSSRVVFEDDLEVEPRGDGSFVARKRCIEGPSGGQRGATPLYGRCRI